MVINLQPLEEVELPTFSVSTNYLTLQRYTGSMGFSIYNGQSFYMFPNCGVFGHLQSIRSIREAKSDFWSNCCHMLNENLNSYN